MDSPGQNFRGSNRSLMATAFALGSYARPQWDVNPQSLTASFTAPHCRLWVLRKPTESADGGENMMIEVHRRSCTKDRAVVVKGPVKIAGFAQTNELQADEQ